MALSFPLGFRIHIPEPVEVKMVSPTLADRNAIDRLERYRGLFTYVVEEDKFYYLGEGIENTHWKPIGTPQAVVVFDVFTGETQKIISGYGLKTYLEANYYTKSQVDALLGGLQIPPHIASISEAEVQKLKTIQSDISRRIDFPEAKILWLIPHEPNKSVTSYLPDGREIYGRKIQINPTLTSINWAQPKIGYVLIN